MSKTLCVRFIALELLALLAAMAAGFQNPIIPGFNPDPSIQRVGEDYFLVTSTFEFFPGVPVYHSKDLIKWEVIGHVLNRPSQLNMRGTAPSGGIFAPTLRYHTPTKTFYMITTWFDTISPPDNVTRTPRSMYVTSQNIFDESAWSDPKYVEQVGFDPDLFWDSDGKVWLTTTSGAQFVDPDSGYFAIWITEIDIRTGNSLRESQLFHVSSLPLDAPRLAEGSHLFTKDGYYYLLTAEAGTEVQHRSMIKRSKSLFGEWEQNPGNPILFNGANTSNPILATGHGDFVQTPAGDWYMVFLGIRPQNPENSQGHQQLGRETFLAPVEWIDGWPVVNGGNFITFDMPGLYDLARPEIWRDDFNGQKLLDKAYYTQRTPYKQFYSLTERHGYLRLRGNPYTLSDRETPAALFRKQVDLETTFSTVLDFQPTTSRQEAGITVFLSIHYHNDISIMLHPDDTSKRVVVVQTRTGTDAALNKTYYDIPSNGPIGLFIDAKKDGYSLGYSVGDSDPVYVAHVENRWLQAWLQGWQNFVGTHFGVYATGNILSSLAPADFDFIQTKLH